MLRTPRPETTNEGWLRRINNGKEKKRTSQGLGPARCKHATVILTYKYGLRRQGIANRTHQHEQAQMLTSGIWNQTRQRGRSHEQVHVTTHNGRWAAQTQSHLIYGPKHTNPKWQGGLIISADLPAIICGPTRDFMREFLMIVIMIVIMWAQKARIVKL